MTALQMMILEQQYRDDLKKELQGITCTSAGSIETSTEVVQTGESTTSVHENIDHDDMGKLMLSRKRRGLVKAIEVITFFYSPYAELRYLIKSRALPVNFFSSFPIICLSLQLKYFCSLINSPNLTSCKVTDCL